MDKKISITISLNLENWKSIFSMISFSDMKITLDCIPEFLQLEAIKNDPYAIQYITNPTEKIQLNAVTQNGHAIKYIKNPSEEVKLAAVKRKADAIRWIKNPSEKVQLAAVKRNGWAIKYIKYKSEVVQLAALKQNRYAIRHIENPSKKAKFQIIKTDAVMILKIKIKHRTKEDNALAIEKYPSLIRSLYRPNKDLQLRALDLFNKDDINSPKPPTWCTSKEAQAKWLNIYAMRKACE